LLIEFFWNKNRPVAQRPQFIWNKSSVQKIDEKLEELDALPMFPENIIISNIPSLILPNLYRASDRKESNKCVKVNNIKILSESHTSGDNLKMKKCSNVLMMVPPNPMLCTKSKEIDDVFQSTKKIEKTIILFDTQIVVGDLLPTAVAALLELSVTPQKKNKAHQKNDIEKTVANQKYVARGLVSKLRNVRLDPFDKVSIAKYITDLKGKFFIHKLNATVSMPN